MKCNKTGLTDKDFKTILDVLNVFDPKDIVDHIPSMGTSEFMRDVNVAFRAVVSHVNRTKYGSDLIQEIDKNPVDENEDDLDEQDYAEADAQRYREDKTKEMQALAHDQFIHGLS